MDKKEHDEKMTKVCDSILFGIEQEGFHYYFCDWRTPDGEAMRANLDPSMLDPMLRHLWDEYLKHCQAIEDYCKTAGGRRESPDG